MFHQGVNGLGAEVADASAAGEEEEEDDDSDDD